MRPVILLTAGYEISPNGQQRRYLFQNYADAITLAGGIPLLPLDNGELADELFDLCDGILFTGGPDLEPKLYNQEKLPQCGRIDDDRDFMEYRLLKRFEKGEKPIFGICRGLQILNVYFGGTLWQDIPTQLGGKHSGGDDPHNCIHETKLYKGSILHSMYGDSMITNSYHHQSIDKVGDGFEVVADSDGIVEAIEHKTLPIWAVQWHPERMTGPARFMHHGPDSAPIFADFIAKCKK
ncbi:MAG: gamma-glutamyl-gamma-aminobutyrate hydrolase family protein [Oscillospiraceae bacterium]|nr:gamma-glutamyl-gamma-aminobutyrate hydrolase family protein [Oscillospiraceae bacterium]MBP1556585.1 gamma-glutamyl-gamma-aminobutyrate hydrolase family protein [Oscillospiraceae bacterium]